MVIAKKYVLIRAFEGDPKRDDMKIIEEELAPLKDGEYLSEAEYLSVDPYMRPYMERFPIPADMIGSQVAKVIQSKNPRFPVGTRVVGFFGWRSHTIVRPDDKFWFPITTLPDYGNLPYSLALGVLGMPGNTAYFGFLEICKPKAGETVVVTGAAGAVGSHVGQIAKIYGCKVIGFAGSEEKCEYLKEIGFDATFNYKKVDIKTALQNVAPEGIDCYFDNVGGEMSSIIIGQMKNRGRISVCGSISSHNEDSSKHPKATILQPAMVFKELRMEGFLVTRWADNFEEGTNKNLQWLKEKKLKYRETVWNGFDNMFDAFAGMLRGENIGKAIVKF